MTVVPAQVTKMMLSTSTFQTTMPQRHFYEQLGFRSVFETEDKADAEAAARLGMPLTSSKATPMQLPDGSMLDLIGGPTPWTVFRL